MGSLPPGSIASVGSPAMAGQLVRGPSPRQQSPQVTQVQSLGLGFGVFRGHRFKNPRDQHKSVSGHSKEWIMNKLFSAVLFIINIKPPQV